MLVITTNRRTNPEESRSMTTRTSKNAAIALAAFALVGTVAGCSAASTVTTTDTSSDTGTDSDTATASGSYTDGTYDASGSYQSPGGNETIEVELTLADNIVTAVTVTGEGATPDSKRYQGEFISGISAEVVGKNIDEIQVDKVAGSSLTSGGFNDAVEQIKSEATA